MPTYEDLRSYFQESEVLQQVVKRAAELSIVSGFTLGVNPVWAVCYDAEASLAHFPIRVGELGELFLDSSCGNRGLAELPDYFSWMTPRYQGYRRRDLKKHIPAWDKISRDTWSRTGELLPVTLTIAHRPLRPPILDGRDRPPDATDAGEEALRQLVRIGREAPVAIRIEERPVARFAVAAGDGVVSSASKSGTLGGVLRDTKGGQLYGVSCSHVVSTGQAIFDSPGSFLATCIADTVRVPLFAPNLCDPVNLAVPNPSPGNGPQLNMLDCSLLSLSQPVSQSPMAGVARSLTPGQNVVFHGAKTGTTRHKLGSLCMSYDFVEGAQHFCFRDAIELVPQSWLPIGGFLNRWLATLPTQGDSGGWVLTDDHPPAWAGVFFGEDGQRGFVIRASWAHDWAQRTTGQTLLP